MYNMSYVVVIRNDSVADLCIYNTKVFIILE
jgi:hypothetical protein